MSKVVLFLALIASLEAFELDNCVLKKMVTGSDNTNVLNWNAETLKMERLKGNGQTIVYSLDQAILGGHEPVYTFTNKKDEIYFYRNKNKGLLEDAVLVITPTKNSFSIVSPKAGLNFVCGDTT